MAIDQLPSNPPPLLPCNNDSQPTAIKGQAHKLSEPATKSKSRVIQSILSAFKSFFSKVKSTSTPKATPLKRRNATKAPNVSKQIVNNDPAPPLPPKTQETAPPLPPKLGKAATSNTATPKFSSKNIHHILADVEEGTLLIDQQLTQAKSLREEVPLEINERFDNLPGDDLTRDDNLNTTEFTEFKNEAKPKYKNINYSAKSGATKNHIYHANKIDLPMGSYIAAQGPISTTHDNFVRMLVENDSPISVALVNKNDLFANNGREKNIDHIGSKNVGEEMIIPAKFNKQDQEIAPEITIKLINQESIDNDSIRVDTFIINGKIHHRINEMGWEDHTAGSPARLGMISTIAERLRLDDSVIDRLANPTTVNCNAGVGRTGTFITANNLTRHYIEDFSVPHPTLDQVIGKGRESRNKFVQTPQQLETLVNFEQHISDIMQPLMDETYTQP